MTSLREGIAATRIADFLNQQLKLLGQINGPAGALIAVDTGEQCSISGVGPIYEHFIQTGKLMNYSGYGTEASTFHDNDFNTASLRIVNYDETFYKMPYDVRKSEFNTL